MERLRTLLAVVLTAVLTWSSPLAALSCPVAEDIVLALGRSPTGSGFTQVQAQIAAALVLERVDLAFEGTLVRKVALPGKSNLETELYHFREVRWLKGPHIGQRVATISVLHRLWCDGCRDEGLEVVYGKDPYPGSVWVGYWPRVSDRQIGLQNFMTEPDVVLGMCDRLRAESPDPPVQVELDRAISQMRNFADREEVDRLAAGSRSSR